MKKILTIVLDGFGLIEEEKGNAIKAAKMNVFNEFYENNPHTKLWASEERVGLLPGQMGSSEVGHMTIGAGRVIKSNMTMIKEFFDTEKDNNESYQKLMRDNTKTVHIMGLCSDGNVHSNIKHFISMYDLLVDNGFNNICFHLITDGRDTKVNVAYDYIKAIEDKINERKIGLISTICGRYYAMDRDQNYDRTKKYYDLVTKGVGVGVLNIKQALDSSYDRQITDEFIKPIITSNGKTIKDGDILLWMNFRTDRAKQILKAFSPKFEEFAVKEMPNLEIYTFYNVDKQVKADVFFKDDYVENPLGLYLSKLGLKQARIAESEKYAHITYFFDGEYDGKIDNCTKFHIPSPEVETYDLKPEMSAIEVTKKTIECMEKDYDFIFTNFANPDMVGHTGNMEAATKACMAIDICLGKIIEAAENNFYTIFLLADHGNCDTMLNEDGSVCTTHSLALVPFVINDPKVKLKDNGDLSNVAPTILDYMDISIPVEMTSDSLLIEE